MTSHEDEGDGRIVEKWSIEVLSTSGISSLLFVDHFVMALNRDLLLLEDHLASILISSSVDLPRDF